MCGGIYIRKEERATLNIYGSSDRISDMYDVWLNGIKAVLSECVVPSVKDFFNSGYRELEGSAECASFLRFDSDERVLVRCVPKRANVVNAVLRPLSGGSRVSHVDGGIEFTLARPGYYALETDSACETLHIFFEPCRDFSVNKFDKNVLWFDSGVHDVGEVRLTSDQTVYIAPNAVVYGSFIAVNASNIRICGYGILDGSRLKYSETDMRIPESDNLPFDLDKPDEFLSLRDSLLCAKGGIQLYGCKNVRIDGITLRDCASYAASCVNCERVTIEHVKSIGMWRYASGGMTLINSSDCAISSCFVRSNDDCVSVKGIRGFDSLPCLGMSVSRCMLWCDRGHAIMVGSETHADEISGLQFKSCDLIRATNAVMGILNRDRANINHIEFKQMRAEYSLAHSMPSQTEPPAIADITVFGDSLFGGGDENGSISDIVFRDIHLRTEAQTASRFHIEGLDSRHDVKNVEIDGLFINGMRVGSFTNANIFVNAFASKIVFA